MVLRVNCIKNMMIIKCLYAKSSVVSFVVSDERIFYFKYHLIQRNYICKEKVTEQTCDCRLTVWFISILRIWPNLTKFIHLHFWLRDPKHCSESLPVPNGTRWMYQIRFDTALEPPWRANSRTESNCNSK